MRSVGYSDCSNSVTASKACTEQVLMDSGRKGEAQKWKEKMKGLDACCARRQPGLVVGESLDSRQFLPNGIWTDSSIVPCF